jgi:anion-transporting  ArsA/GET3 family ATPase
VAADSIAADLDQRLDGKRICICAGAGGVGKTTTAAALALGLAARGQRVAVVTIDPARRLAAALGLDQLDNEPRLIDRQRFAGHGLEVKGELWAMMLDPKRTFDELIARLAPDERRRDEVLSNRIYQQLSSAVAGSQEFTAVAKLYDLDREGGFDVIVLDTPPSRNALDFLDAPARLTQFFEGRALRLLLAPTGLATRIVGRGTSAAFAILRRVTGVDLLRDLTTFFRVLGDMVEGFNQRAAEVGALLRDPATTFLLVTSPEHQPVTEALAFAAELEGAAMPRGALIVNRIAVDEVSGRAGTIPGELGAALRSRLGAPLAERVAQTVADHDLLVRRDRRSIEMLAAALGEPAPILIPEFEHDVHDVAGLVQVVRHLFGEAGAKAPSPTPPRRL